MSTVDIINIVLDIVLVLVSLWMVYYVRGIGGVVGRTLTFITIGIVILGAAHLLATLTGDLLAQWDGPIHRVVVLVGFIVLVVGFRQMQTMRR